VRHRRDSHDVNPKEAATEGDAGHVLEDSGMLNESGIGNNSCVQHCWINKNEFNRKIKVKKQTILLMSRY